MLYIVIGILVVLAIIIVCAIVIYNKFQLTFIKIDEAENNIDLLLEKKLDFFNRMVPLLEQEKVENDQAFFEIKKFKSQKWNHFQMRDALEKKTKELNEILDLKAELVKNKSIASLLDELVDVNTDLDAAIKYYNDNVVIYNKLIRCFPSNLLGLILRYKNKEFYSDEKEEMFEILKK